MNKSSIKSFSIPEKIIYAIIAIITLYFLSITAFPKLIMTQKVYGDYYWFRASWLIIHVVTGLIATLTGWTQFIPQFRIKYMKVHRLVGKVYIICILIASFTAFFLAYYSPGMNLSGRISFFVVPFIWSITVIFAYLAVIKKRIIQHQEWMIRSYVVTFFFTIFVIITKYFPYETLNVTYLDIMALVTWFSWSVPLFIAELVIQGRKIW